MKRKLFFIIALACCLVFAVGILAACNDSGSNKLRAEKLPEENSRARPHTAKACLIG